jgi:hypothetical protein
MSRLRIWAPLTGALLLALPAVADAAPPKVKTTRITVGESIGGVKIGQSVTAARGVWGSGKCVNSGGVINARVSSFVPLDTHREGACDFGKKNAGLADFYFYQPKSSDADPDPEALISGVRVSAAYLGYKFVYPPGKPPRTVSRYKFAKPFTRFKTSKGIRLGSTLKQLKKKYPSAKRKGPDSFHFGRPDRNEVARAELRHYVVTSSNGFVTAFTVDAGHVVKIAIRGFFEHE